MLIRVPLADVRVPEEDIEVASATYRSGWLSMGPETERFEHEFAQYTGASEAVAVTNGTAAIHLICAAGGLGPGDEVIVPSLTFVATVNAVAYTGARPVFADISALDSPWLSVGACEAVTGERTAAVLAMPYGGHAGEIEGLRALADRRGLLLLEDAAHAAGSRLDGRHLGRFGTAGAFSLFSNKNLAVGEGGIAITDDHELASQMRLLRSHGMTTLTWERHLGQAASYDVIALGYNYRIDEPRAALARTRLSRLDDENDCRRRLDTRYRDLLADINGVTPTAPPSPRLTSSHHLFTIVLDERLDRDAFRTSLAKAGIQTSVHYPPAHALSIYREGSAELPLTNSYAAHTVTLPMFPHMTVEQQDLVVEATNEAALSGFSV
jgi:dTDP-4-amino-4,6-dideoxygalactose transaminase